MYDQSTLDQHMLFDGDFCHIQIKAGRMSLQWYVIKRQSFNHFCGGSILVSPLLHIVMPFVLSCVYYFRNAISNQCFGGAVAITSIIWSGMPLLEYGR